MSPGGVKEPGKRMPRSSMAEFVSTMSNGQCLIGSGTLPREMASGRYVNVITECSSDADRFTGRD